MTDEKLFDTRQKLRLELRVIDRNSLTGIVMQWKPDCVTFDK